MKKDNSLQLIIEGALMASQDPLTLQDIANLFDENKPSKNQIKLVIEELNNNYKHHSFEITLVASGYRLQVKTGYDKWLSKLNKQTSTRYSKAFLETLVIIAYKQPVTRGDIESIRGVSVSSSIMRTLTDRNWIKIVGYRDVPGKPAMFSTTNEFLDYFGLEKLTELPDLPDIKEPQNLSLDLEAETTNEMTQISTEQLN